MRTYTRMREQRFPRLVALAALCIASGCPDTDSDDPPAPPLPPPSESNLGIAPVAQQTEVWCWAASQEMVCRYYGLPNLNSGGDYQCGIVAAYSILVYGFYNPCNYNCYICESTIANTSEMWRSLVGYGQIANQLGIPSRVLSAKVTFGPLSLQGLAIELDERRPVLAGVNFSPGFSLPGISQHLVVLTGYDATVSVPTVLVNDPFPYAMLHDQPDPYITAGAVLVQPGQYRLPYDTFVAALRWDNTIYQIQ